MKKLFFILILLFTASLCFAKTAHGAECEKSYEHYDGTTYRIAVMEIQKQNENNFRWCFLLECYDNSKSRMLYAIIYYKSKSAVLNYYLDVMKSYNKKTLSFDDMLDFLNNPDNHFVSDLTIDEELNIPVYLYYSVGEI